MAEASISLGQDQFICSVCLGLLKGPVTLHCGHSYCKGCIKDCWDQEDHVGVYSCPQCRQIFKPRPVLNKNIVLAQVVEKLKKSELQTDQCYAGPGDVECDVCTGRKNKAVKSCLVCLASYCKTDLQLHDKLNRGKQHKLINATRLLQDKICSHHNKLLEIYCCTDQQCICYQCTMDEHRGHNTVSAAAGRSEKQKQLEVIQREFQQRIQKREKEAQELREAVKSFTRSAQVAVMDTYSIFTEMIHSLKKRWSEVKDLIRAQEKEAVSQAQDLLEQMELEIAELRRRDAKIQDLSYSEDHIHFLRHYQPLCAAPQSGKLSTITFNPHTSFNKVVKLLSELKEKQENYCEEISAKIFQTAATKFVLRTAEPKIREEFIQYACQLTLDQNTVSKYLGLSERNTVVSPTTRLQPYPDHPEQFDHWYQLLCTEGLIGCCYWEVEWGGSGGVYIAVAYRGLSRKGRGYNCGLGHNDKSWSLICSPSGYYYLHNNKKTAVPGPSSSIIGVYLDHGAGTLSFYSVSDTMTLLHRVQTTFTEPVFPGFGFLFRWFRSYPELKLRSLE